MKAILIGSVLLFATTSCTPTADVRMHRANGNVEKLETWKADWPSTYMTCNETSANVHAVSFDCKETQLK